MCSLFRNKFRNESFRLNGHDYSSDCTYFITICTHNRLSYFGNISNGKMILSETGSPKPGSLATVIRSYKSAVSKNVHLIDPDFSWQPLYYDHIIRSGALHATSLDRIRDYIINNPVKWNYH